MNYPEPIFSKLPNIGTTIFSVMSQLAAEEKAINLSQGFPDFEVSRDLMTLVYDQMKAGFNQYAPMQGDIGLREQIVSKTYKLYGQVYDPETEVTITAGGTQAIYTAITALLHEDDEVVVFTPAYDCYVPAIELTGANPVFIELHAPDYSIDWDEVKKMINHRTKMIIMNSPHNPSGTIWSSSDMEELERIVSGTGIIVLSDEVYQHIVFDGKEHQSVARYPGLAERSFLIGSFGKTFHITGWKVGYAMAPKELMKEFNKVHQFVTFAVNHPVQKALAEYLKTERHYLGIAEMYQNKRDLFIDALSGSRFKIKPSEGTYFQLLDYSDINDDIDTAYARELTRKYKVASIPISVFYKNESPDRMLRFCFAKQDETLMKAAEILNAI
ncbi:aminotransferase class I/II-fold pyridoxal phosphate-dependent enzyme [bacterium SCSIO 12643]|nr:aminotransferase class I/II-fold pyridoxal phosphate-dependent enzyme [bacterium SCSIO 12643]